MNIVGTSTAENPADFATISATPHANTAVGDLVLAFLIINAGASGSQTPASGFSLVGYTDEYSANDRLLIYKKLMATSGDLAECTFTSYTEANMVLALVSVRGPFASPEIEASSIISLTVSTSSDPTVNAPSVTAVTPGGLLICVWSSETATTWSTPAGMTDLCDLVSTSLGNNVSLSAAAEARSAAGATGVRTSTVTAGDSARPMTASLYLAPPPVGGLFWANNF